MSWLSVSEFKQITKIYIDDSTIEEAISFSEIQIKRRIFNTKHYSYNNATTKHELCQYIADYNADSEIDAGDVDAWEEDNEANETDLNANISSVVNNRNRSYLYFDTSLPSTGKTLYVKYRIAKYDIDDMIVELKTLQKLIMTDYLFTNVPFEKLQSGIDSWNLNGVNVNFNLDMMQKVLEQNKIQESSLYVQLRPNRVNGVALGGRYHYNIDRYRHEAQFIR